MLRVLAPATLPWNIRKIVGNAYLRIHDELSRLYADGDFAALFPVLGQPALAPAQLALVTLMQFAEGLSDVRFVSSKPAA